VNPTTDDEAALVTAYLSRHGPVTAAAIVAALKQDAARVSEAMSRLLDAHQIVVVRVNQAGEPLYDVAAS
jgi:hypothetical protein